MHLKNIFTYTAKGLLTVILSCFFYTITFCDTDCDDVLTKLSEKNFRIFSIKADFKIEKYIYIVENKLESYGDFIFKSPDKFRWETKKPEKSTIICDGEKVTIYYPEIEEKEEYPITKYTWLNNLFKDLPIGSQFDVDMLKKKYNIKRVPGDSASDNVCLKLKPQKAENEVGYKLIEIQVLKKDFSIKKITLYEYDDDMMTISFSNIIHNQDFDEDIFKKINLKEGEK